MLPVEDFREVNCIADFARKYGRNIYDRDNYLRRTEINKSLCKITFSNGYCIWINISSYGYCLQVEDYIHRVYVKIPNIDGLVSTGAFNVYACFSLTNLLSIMDYIRLQPPVEIIEDHNYKEFIRGIIMKEKYKLEYTNHPLIFSDGDKDYTLYRIRATKRFGKVKKGELGGYIEKDALSQSGTCWVGPDAFIYNGSKVSGNAYVGGYASVSHSEIKDNAFIDGSPIIKDSIIEDCAKITDMSEIIHCAIGHDIAVGGRWKIRDYCSDRISF